MARKFEETPYNFSEFNHYVITDPKIAGSKLIKASRCYIYDTCTFRKHMLLQNPMPLFDYIKQTEGIIMMTRCILMELCSSDCRLWQEGITYLKRLREAGISVLLLFEEDLFEVLMSCFASAAKVNRFLTFAVRAVKSETGTVETTLEEEPFLKKYILAGAELADRQLYRKFFMKARQNKEAGDHLGEELLLICLYMLCYIPEFNDFKYILLTEDKGAISRLIQVKHNVERHIRPNCLTAFTSAKLAQLLWESKLMNSCQSLRDFLDTGNHDEQLRVYCAEKYDMSAQNKGMTVDDLARKIVTESGIHIYY